MGGYHRLDMESLGSGELAYGWAVHPLLWAGFQGPDWAGHGLCLSPRPCQPPGGSDLGLGYDSGLSVYCPVMPLSQSSPYPCVHILMRCRTYFCSLVSEWQGS